jgi:hypothetical protein
MRTGQQHDPGASGGPMLHEADIGSGERTPAQQETDQMIKEIPPLKSDEQAKQDGGKSGNPGAGR